MPVSRRKDKNNNFSDVQTGRGKGARKFFALLANRGRVIDLKPTFFKRHPLSVLIAVIFASVASFFGFRQLFTRAEVADFYPSTCLGTWTGVQNAQNKPEMLLPESASTTFNEGNSAIFLSGTGQIFCGGFVSADYPQNSDVKSVGITFVWQVGEPTQTSTFPQETKVAAVADVSSTTATTTATNATSSPAVPPQPVQGPSTAPVSAATTSLLFDFRSLIFNFAYAQTDASGSPQVANDSTTPAAAAPSAPAPAPAPAPEPAVLPSPTPTSTSRQTASGTEPAVVVGQATDTGKGIASSSQAIVIEPPLGAVLSPVASSTGRAVDAAEATGTVPVPVDEVASSAAQQPDGNFLQVSYSTDGQTWVAIAKVSANNWQNFTITLPISNWGDLKKLQIQIAGIPTTQNPTPRVYLDGMFAEVHYDIPPAFEGSIGGGPSGNAPQAGTGPVQVPAGVQVITLPPSQKPTPANPGQNTFKADETPQFDLNLNSLSAPSSTPNP